jgi:predicted RNA binding protein YcfA (HicA-like mRNA interferase family)
MANIEKIRETIAEIGESPKNVTAAEIEWVINQLEQHGFQVRRRKTLHGILYVVNSSRFSICTHHPGSKQIRACYVYEFLRVMMEMGLYED